MIYTKTLIIHTKKHGDIVDLTSELDEVVKESKINLGIVHVFAPHATAVFALTELESRLKDDIRKLLDFLTPESGWKHGRNAHSHLRSMLFAPDRTLPVRDGKIVKGTWQSLFFIEADVSGRNRKIEITIIGKK
jgi:secondary thiamine-phosphate synthase enzyme